MYASSAVETKLSPSCRGGYVLKRQKKKKSEIRYGLRIPYLESYYSITKKHFLWWLVIDTMFIFCWLIINQQNPFYKDLSLTTTSSAFILYSKEVDSLDFSRKKSWKVFVYKSFMSYFSAILKKKESVWWTFFVQENSKTGPGDRDYILKPCLLTISRKSGWKEIENNFLGHFRRKCLEATTEKLVLFFRTECSKTEIRVPFLQSHLWYM